MASLKEMAPLFFAFNRLHYQKIILQHLSDMLTMANSQSKRQHVPNVTLFGSSNEVTIFKLKRNKVHFKQKTSVKATAYTQEIDQQ